MKKNLEKKHIHKIIGAVLGLILLAYGQCGYAVIEEYLTPVEGKPCLFDTPASGISIITLELATEFISYLKDNKLRKVNIGYIEKNMRPLVFDAIVEAVQNKNPVLASLDLGGSLIDYERCMAVVEALRSNTVLTELYLAVSHLGNEAIIKLAEVLRNNNTLTTLNIVGNFFDTEGLTALTAALLNNTVLTELYLGGNEIDSEGVKMLVEVLQHNAVLTMLDLEGVTMEDEDISAIHAALVDNYTILILRHSFDAGENREILLRNYLLINLLHKVKRASAFAFSLGFYQTALGRILPNILGFVGLDIHNRPSFRNVQDYNNASIRDIIFRGSLEEVIKLFYYGTNLNNYREIISEVNQIRRLQIGILLENNREIPEGLLELPEDFPGNQFLLMRAGERQILTTAVPDVVVRTATIPYSLASQKFFLARQLNQQRLCGHGCGGGRRYCQELDKKLSGLNQEQIEALQRWCDELAVQGEITTEEQIERQLFKQLV